MYWPLLVFSSILTQAVAYRGERGWAQSDLPRHRPFSRLDHTSKAELLLLWQLSSRFSSRPQG